VLDYILLHCWITRYKSLSGFFHLHGYLPLHLFVFWLTSLITDGMYSH